MHEWKSMLITNNSLKWFHTICNCLIYNFLNLSFSSSTKSSKCNTDVAEPTVFTFTNNGYDLWIIWVFIMIMKTIDPCLVTVCKSLCTLVTALWIHRGIYHEFDLLCVYRGILDSVRIFAWKGKWKMLWYLFTKIIPKHTILLNNMYVQRCF